MRIYCLLAFWLTVLGIALRVSYVSSGTYPRVVTYRSAAEDLMALIFKLCALMWLGNILWNWL